MIVVIGVGGYWFAKRTAARDIAKQLDALEIGPHEIGSVSVGLNGVAANDIEFFKEGESDKPAWLTVERLTVEHPLLELAQGTSSYNAIELAGVKATLDSASLFESDSEASLNLSELELPAKQVRLKDAQVVIVDPVKSDLAIKDIQLQLDQNEDDSVTIEGKVGDLLGTKVDIAGDLPANREQLSVTLLADEFKVATQQWQNLPGLPQGIDKNLTVDGNLNLLSCAVTVKNDDLKVDGSAEIDQLAIGLPQFDLPVSVNQGSIGFDTKQIELTDLMATIDGGTGEVRGKTVTEFAKFPIKTTFDTNFQDVLAGSLRKIVVAIPEILIAKASGSASGTVLVESSIRTTINLEVDAAGTDGLYGKIKAKTLGAKVQINNLIFDEQQNYESIEGLIDATAETDQQSLSDVLKTFELDVFDQQMQIVGNANGKMNLQMPLATAEDMRTWKMKIEGVVPTGSVSGQKFINADATVEMIDGILQFNPVNVLAVADNSLGDADVASDSNLKLNVRWPMVPETAQGDEASIGISGANVPATWLMGLAQKQIASSTAQPAQPNADVQSDTLTKTDAMARVDQIDGSVAFETTLILPTATPDDVYTWKVDGTLRDSKINVGDDRLQDLAGSIQMNNGQLNVENISGNFYNQAAQNGSVGGAAAVNLKQPSQASADLNLKQLPLPWLISVAQELAPQYSEQLQQPPIDSLMGQIDADVKYRSSPDNPMQALDVAVRSAELIASGQKLQDLKINGSFDGKQIKVAQLTGRVGESGALDAKGNWSIETNQAAGTLNLQQLPLPWLVTVAKETLPQYADQLQQPAIDTLTGQIGADVTFQFSPEDQTQSFDVVLESPEMNVSGQQIRDFRLEGSFDGKQIKVAQLTSLIGKSGELSGQGDWSIETNQGAGNLNMKQFPLPLIVTIASEAMPQYADQLQQPPIASLAGQIDTDLKFQFSPDDQTQSVEMVLGSAKLSVSGQELRDLKLNGSFDGKQIKISQLKSFVGEGGKVEGQGDWSVETNQATGNLEWDKLPLATLAAFVDMPSPIEGNSNGKLAISTRAAGQANLADYQVTGAVGLKDLQMQQFQARDVGFDVATRDGALHIHNVRNANGELGVDLGGQVALTAPYRFEASGKITKLPLTELLSSIGSVDDQIEAASLTGILKGDFNIAGQVENFDWKTDGKIDCLRPTYNGIALEDFKANWDLEANKWDQAKLTIEIFDGSVDLVELANLPDSIRLKMKDIDAAQVATVAESPTKLTGKISGDLLLKNIDQPEERSVDLDVSGKSIRAGGADLGDLTLTANYLNEALKYKLNGSVFSGKLTGEGSTSLKESELATLKLPLKITLNNASVDGLKAAANSKSLRPLTGRLSAQADLLLGLDGTITADGRMGVDQAKWNSQLITRQASVHFKLTEELLFLDELDIDLKRGTIAGQATIPLANGADGRYEIAVRNLDLDRLTELYTDDFHAHGLLDGRMNGSIGRQITGRGFVGVQRASLNGVAGESFRLPLQFQISSQSGAGKLELRRSSFRIFDGNASGKAEVAFGTSFNVNVDMNLSNIDTEKMLSEIAGVSQDQGKLTGRFKLSGRGVRSTRNLKGSFRGSLARASALELPVLSDVGRLLSVTNLQQADFDSDSIELVLSNNQIDVKQLNFSSSLVKIAITGQAFLDGRLNLSAATRVETFQQPTLLDELAGSPLANLSIGPVGAVTRLSEFLSERIVFLKIGGNVSQPQVRVDTSQQLPAEVIRYFLPSSNVLPILNDLNN